MRLMMGALASETPYWLLICVLASTVRLSEAPSYGESIFGYAPDSRGARAYAALAEEVLGRLQRGQT